MWRAKLKIYTPKSFPLPFETAITIGSFDGVHQGHKNLVRETLHLSSWLQVKPLVVFFDPHPRKVLFPEANFKLLTTFEEKLDIFSRFNIDVVIIPFSSLVAQLTADLFVEQYLVDALKAKGIVVGFNFRFGKNRKGDPDYLIKLGVKYGFTVKVLNPVVFDGVVLSSTYIRHLIEKGKMEEANKFLGHNYFMIGKVKRGRGVGKNLGFPTANLEIPQDKLLPPCGVYAVWVYHKDKKWKGAMNIGFRPTFKEKEFSVEVHVLNFNREIYEEKLKVEIVKKIREERKFSSLEELKTQIKKDCELIDKILEDH